MGVNLRNQGQQVGMVNILTNGITQLMCKGSAITSPQELVGKKILVPFKKRYARHRVASFTKKN